MPWMPEATARPVPSHSGMMRGHFGLVLHVQVGDNSCYGEFANPANQASSTWWVGKNGSIEQYVDSDLAAWTEAAGNFTWDSVETEGLPSESLTSQQIASLAKIYAWGHRIYGWPLVLTDDPNGRGFGWHGMGGTAWGGHFGCPGDLRKAQRSQILSAASLILNLPRPSTAIPVSPPPASPPPSGANVQLPTLSLNSSGGFVRTVQFLMHDKSSQQIACDGHFGPVTEQAVKNVQAFFRWAVDGVVGASTWELLLGL